MQPDYPPDGPKSWQRLAIALIAGTISSIGMWSVVLVLPVVGSDFGVGRAEASLPYTATMLGFAAGNLLLGRLVDAFGMARVLLLAGVTLGAGFMLAALSPSILVFAALQGLMIGTATAAGFGPLMADVSHWFSRRRGIAVAIVASGNYLAGAIWPLALRPLLEAGDWRGAYLVIGLICIVSLPAFSLLLRPRLSLAQVAANAPRRPGAGGSRDTGFTPRMLQGLLAVAGIGCCVAMAMPQVHIVALCADLGYGVTAGAQMLSLMLAAGIVSRLASGFLADVIGGIPTLLLGSILQALALTLYLPFDGLASLYVVSLIFGLSQGGIVPSYAVIVREYMPAEEAGRRIGFVIMATILGMAFGGWLSGLIFDLTGSYRLAFINGIAWNGLNIGIMLFILWRSGGLDRPSPARAA